LESYWVERKVAKRVDQKEHIKVERLASEMGFLMVER
jgi:hypothetical protein